MRGENNQAANEKFERAFAMKPEEFLVVAERQRIVKNRKKRRKERRLHTN